MEYLGLWVTRDGVKTIDKKIEAINNMTPLITWKVFHNFICLVN